ncbi:hypothetical protein G3O00_41425 [Burkholderia sp. Ac-20384]|uniref:hypothetical protein n=1 Tax=Burkholderia sp. Ac-20384 TaxID=2703902 RepID=UPI00197DF0A4|nr:hypothetical protein [Burkholderia sp. Ac-20384]MBN3829980.1 hypothetical protein [Burkholderia sp. Ac-20384]
MGLSESVVPGAPSKRRNIRSGRLSTAQCRVGSARFPPPVARDRSTRLAAMSSHVSMIDSAAIGTAIAGARVFARAAGITMNRQTSFHLKSQ